MRDFLKSRWIQKCHTVPFPGDIKMPERFRGRPIFHAEKSLDVIDACPTGAILMETSNNVIPAKAGIQNSIKTLDPRTCPERSRRVREDDKSEVIGSALKSSTIDLGKCLFCQECVLASKDGAVTYSRDIRMAVRERKDLIVTGDEIKLAEALDKKMQKLFGRSLKLRAVSAGSCNGCDMELQALNNVVFDLSRFGIQFVASPRHADGIIVTGPVTKNMELALKKTYEAVPEPKIVIAVGACAISGGPFLASPEVLNGADSTLKVDLYIPGCPPHPWTVLDGLLRLLGRMKI